MRTAKECGLSSSVRFPTARTPTASGTAAASLTEIMDADKTGDGYLLEMFRHELSNHEYGYTRDPEPALLALGIYWEDIGGDERLLHAFETACQQEADWYDKHCEVGNGR